MRSHTFVLALHPWLYRCHVGKCK